MRIPAPDREKSMVMTSMHDADLASSIFAGRRKPGEAANGFFGRGTNRPEDLRGG